MTTPLLELTDVDVLAGKRQILAVPHFAVQPGETVALVGPNGAGKTTLLHVAALLRRPDRGAVTMLGRVATPQNEATLRRSLSVVFQNPLLFDVGVLANAAAGARFHGLPRPEAERRARDWLARFGIAHLARQKARVLSGGEAARVALARAFTTDPALLLLDEPFSALDAPTRAHLLPALRGRLQETGAASVFVTHDLEEAFSFADRVVLMDDGRILTSGDAASLIARPASRRVAELLGLENILPARIARVAGSDVLLELLPAGPHVRIRSDFDAPVVPGQEVVIALPAATIRVLHGNAAAPESWNQLAGQVVTATHSRAGTRLVVETPARIATMAPWEPDTWRWSAGDAVTVAFSPAAGHVIRDL